MSPPSPPLTSTGTGHAPGTCGELVQGTLTGGRRFHVTCPIDRGTTVHVEVDWSGRPRITGLGAHGARTRQAIAAAWALLGLPPAAVRVERRSELPVAKGMASSTADLVAAMRAVADAVGRELPPEAIGRAAAAIEPTDGLMYDGLCAADPGTGERLRAWHWWPSFALAVVVPGASLRTAAADYPGQRRHTAAYDACLATLDDAVAACDDAAFADAATWSAERNERWVPSPVLPALRRAARSTGALGWCVGHSGTAGGLLFSAGDDERAVAGAAALLALVPGAVDAFASRTPPSPAASPAASAAGEPQRVEHRRHRGGEVEARHALAHR